MKKALLSFIAVCTFSAGLMAQGYDLGEIYKIDGELEVDAVADAVWEQATSFNLLTTPLAVADNASSDGTSGTVKALVSPTTLYILVDYKDQILSDDSGVGKIWGNTDDCLDIPVGFGDVDAQTDAGMIDFAWITCGIELGASGANLDTAYATILGNQSSKAKSMAVVDDTLLAAQKITANYGYVIEIAIPLVHLDSAAAVDGDDFSGKTMLFDVRHNDSDGSDIAPPSWAPETATGRDAQWTLGSQKTIEDGWWWQVPYNISRVTISSTVLSTSAIGNTKAATFGVYPNPATDMVKITKVDLGNEICIINLAGQKVLSQAANDINVEMNIAELETGVYFVKVGETAQKLVVR